jgi:hypothetical protein
MNIFELIIFRDSSWSSFVVVIFTSVCVCACVLHIVPQKKSINLELSCKSAEKLISSKFKPSFLAASF